jgi:glycosyltransferase involved in cell wall biosynthesis
MAMNQRPLVSCICITKNEPRLLSRAIECFRYQTYPNTELIILAEDSESHVKEMLGPDKDDRIKCFVVPSTPKMSLGSLRNLAISKANGEYICQWDDDDWYHEKRVEIQLNMLLESHKPACMLAFWLMYDQTADQAYVSHIGPWPGTILCRKSLLTDRFAYPDLSTSEDWELMVALIKHNCVYPAIMPSLYIYAYHGSNTFEYDHFKVLYQYSQPLPENYACLFKKIFNNEISNMEASRLLLLEDQMEPIDYFYSWFDSKAV